MAREAPSESNTIWLYDSPHCTVLWKSRLTQNSGHGFVCYLEDTWDGGTLQLYFWIWVSKSRCTFFFILQSSRFMPAHSNNIEKGGGEWFFFLLNHWWNSNTTKNKKETTKGCGLFWFWFSTLLPSTFGRTLQRCESAQIGSNIKNLKSEWGSFF